MNPLTRWENLKNKEIMEGGKPRVCIMGYDDYATFCGAVQVTIGSDLGFPVFGHADRVEYHGVLLFCSRANKRGIMFA